jgi:hypothetical protein
MDPAAGLPVIIPEEKRAVTELSAFYRDPVVDAGDTREIFYCQFPPVLFCAVNKPDADVLQNVLPVVRDPREDVLYNTLLAPSPLLAAPAALPAFLLYRHNNSPSNLTAQEQSRHFLWILLLCGHVTVRLSGGGFF